MKNRGFTITLTLFLLSTLLLSPNVSAETVLEGIVLGTAESITSIFDKIALNPDNTSVVLLGFLLFIILYSIIIKMKLFKMGKSGAVLAATVAGIITILAFLRLPRNFLESIVLQYGAMGATILTLIPFIIMFYFTFSVTKNLLTAKITWVFYTVYYFTLFMYKIASEEYVGWSNFIAGNLPYIGAIIAGIVVFIWIGRLRVWKASQEIIDMKAKGQSTVKQLKLLNELKKEELKGYT